MDAITISVKIPQPLFDWLKEAVNSGSYANPDAAVVAGLEELRNNYLKRVQQWAQAFEPSALYQLANSNMTTAEVVREPLGGYNAEAYDSAYSAAQAEIYPDLQLPAQTTMALPADFPN